MTLRISIVTPSYNQAQYIKATIETVLSQQQRSLEYIVMDGVSQDNTIQILRSYGTALKWFSEPDQGQADAINKGFQRSQGDILGWLNADDLYCPGTLKEVALQFETNPELMMIYGDACHIDADGNVLDNYPVAEYHWENLAFHCFICQPACFFRRSLIEAVGYLDPRLHYALDLDLWVRFGLAQKKNPAWKFEYLRKLMAYSRMHVQNKTLSKRRESFQEIIQVVKKHFGYVPFNWVYGFEESTGGQFDGYFHRSPLRASLVFKSVFRWILINRKRPAYVLGYIKDCLRSPRQSVRRITRRAGERR